MAASNSAIVFEPQTAARTSRLIDRHGAITMHQHGGALQPRFHDHDRVAFQQRGHAKDVGGSVGVVFLLHGQEAQIDDMVPQRWRHVERSRTADHQREHEPVSRPVFAVRIPAAPGSSW